MQVELSLEEILAERDRRRRGEQLAEEAARLSSSLRSFLEAGWHVVEPKTMYVHSWHIDSVCEHVEAAFAGEIRKLAINIPPRTMKSLTVSVFAPVWRWTREPATRFLTASYVDSLATGFAVKSARPDPVALVPGPVGPRLQPEERREPEDAVPERSGRPEVRDVRSRLGDRRGSRRNDHRRPAQHGGGGVRRRSIESPRLARRDDGDALQRPADVVGDPDHAAPARARPDRPCPRPRSGRVDAALPAGGVRARASVRLPAGGRDELRPRDPRRPANGGGRAPRAGEDRARRARGARQAARQLPRRRPVAAATGGAGGRDPEARMVAVLRPRPPRRRPAPSPAALPGGHLEPGTRASRTRPRATTSPAERGGSGAATATSSA